MIKYGVFFFFTVNSALTDTVLRSRQKDMYFRVFLLSGTITDYKSTVKPEKTSRIFFEMPLKALINQNYVRLTGI